MEGDYGMCHGTDANGNDWTAPCNPKNRVILQVPFLLEGDICADLE